MKQLTCEMCGSTDLIKDGGVFVCQSCGCKYSVEEARKMMIEGTVDVQGTVKVDNSEFVQKYLANARRAKEKEDWEEVEKYYNMVEQNDPDNIEAIFYSAYGKAMTSLTDEDIYKRQAAFKVLTNCISIIDDHYKVERRDENEKAIRMMAADLVKMVNSSFVFTQWKNGYGLVVKDNKVQTNELFVGLVDGFKESIDNIKRVDDLPYLHWVLISLYKGCLVSEAYSASGKKMLENRIKQEEEAYAIAKERAERIEAEKRAKEQAEKQSRVDAYWAEHPEEKAQLTAKQVELQERVKNLEAQRSELRKRIEAVKAKANQRTPSDILCDESARKTAQMKSELASLGIFRNSEKKRLQGLIDAEEAHHKGLMQAAAQERSEQQASIDAELQPLNNDLERLTEEVTAAAAALRKTNNELTRDRK